MAQYLNPEEPTTPTTIVKPDDSGDLSVYRRIVQIAHRNPPVKKVDRVAWESFQYIGMYLTQPFDPERKAGDQTGFPPQPAIISV
ncbi:MAG: hypothetical protein QNK40_11115 [Desulfobacterales bacterium]|nr:hypothetical protein [Desulfobacterales bacterium]